MIDKSTANLFGEEDVPRAPDSEEIVIWVPGIAAPAGSKKGFYNHSSGKVIIVDACEKSRPWKTDVTAFAHAAYRGQVLRGPVIVTAWFYMPRPKGHFGTGKNAAMIKDSASKYPAVAPDLTKLFRAVEDALTGVIWADDAQVVKQNLHKVYEEERGPGVEITIREIV